MRTNFHQRFALASFMLALGAAPTALGQASIAPAAVDQPAAATQPTAAAQPAAAAQPTQPATPNAVSAEPLSAQSAPTAPDEPPIAADATAADNANNRAQLLQLLTRARAERAAAARNRQLEANSADAEQAHGDAGAALALGLSIVFPWYTDPGYDVFSSDNVPEAYGLWAAYDVFALRTDTIGALELGWDTEHSESSVLGDTLNSDLQSHAAHAALQLRYVPVDFLQPHLRLAAGVSFVAMALRTSSPSERFTDDAVSPFGSLGLGLTLRTPTRLFEDKHGNLASLSVGVMVEGGYTLAAPLDFKLDGPGPGKRAIALTEPSLGTLDRSGPYIRVSFVGRI